ncbi:MAG: radical SAM protein [Elusimicrobia bacterium]|nr:radical SAM protein [Elusimicrobiota bacterium]
MAEIAYLQVQRACNQACLFCSNPSNGRSMPFKEAVARLDDYARSGQSGVILTGGEPTLYPHLPELIRAAKTRGIETRIITNGSKTRDLDYLAALADAGLDSMHVSVFSNRADVHNYLAAHGKAFDNIRKTLENAGSLRLDARINSVINKYNSDHLSEIPRWIVRDYPFVHHFSLNNLDPLMVRPDHRDTIPRFSEFELELHRWMDFIHSTGRTFRVERVPLCYMTGFEHCSTETRKIVKQEGRAVHFLDQRGFRQVSPSFFKHDKSDRCKDCTLEPICGGVLEMDIFYDSKEISPVFVSPEPIVEKILAEHD